MKRSYKLSGLLSLTLPLAALAGSEATASPVSQAQAIHQIQAQQAQAMRAAANRAQRLREAKILTQVTVAGRVLDESGKPLPNVAVNVNWLTPQNEAKSVALLTDAQGKFKRQMEVKSRSHTLRLCAIVPGKNCDWKRLTLTDKPLPATEMHLQPGIALSGRLFASDGSPLTNQTLHIQSIVSLGANIDSGAAMQQMAMQSNNMDKMLPSALSAKLFCARTDAMGRFTFTGLPKRCVVQLTPDKPLLLAQGSLLPVTIVDNAQELGTLVAVRAGSATVLVTDPATGKPVANAQINATITDFNTATIQLMNMMNGAFRAELTPTARTNAQGIATFAGMRPGSYYAYLDNKFEKLTVEEGKAAPLITLALRQEPLTGRIVDANGKPIAGLEVKTNSLMKTDEEITRLSPFARFGEFGWENRAMARTDAEGRFSLPRTAWAGEQLTVRATQGNARAEWRGSPAKIRGELTLKMQPNALITVTGRLIDPQRRLLRKAQFQSIHWTAAPRSFWVSNARTATLDAEGRFKIEGLERGESFSLITRTRFSGFTMNGNGMTQNGSKNVPFESPRFSTQTTGQQQDMGDVMVHPLDDPEDLDDVYGFSGQPSIAKFPGMLPAPSQDSVKEAKQALLIYRSLLKTGDMKRAYEMTSHLTPGWSADYKTYLQRAILREGHEEFAPSLEKSVAMRYVPRAVAASLASGNSRLFAFGASPDSSPLVKELSRSNEWVFLMDTRDGTAFNTGILRKEEGQWHIVNTLPGAFSGGDPFQLSAFGGGASSNAADFSKPLPAATPEALASARKAAELYLHEWAAERPSALRTLTSLFSPLAVAKPDEFARAFHRRADEGICPLMADEQPVLEPLSDVSLWEQQWIADLTMNSQMQNRNRIFRNNNGFVAPQDAPNGAFPADYAKRGDIVLFRYKAQGRDYIISLVRNKNKWSVLEPAFVQSEPAPRDVVLR